MLTKLHDEAMCHAIDQYASLYIISKRYPSGRLYLCSNGLLYLFGLLHSISITETYLTNLEWRTPEALTHPTVMTYARPTVAMAAAKTKGNIVIFKPLLPCD